MPQLDRYRRIWLYLPAGYDSSEATYPVIYMHDGQNLFEEWSAFSEEWSIDETLDEQHGQCIVVGIDNGGGKRLTEYNIYDHPEYGKGEGRSYLDFIVQTLKPYIDHHFRTKEEREFTWIGGSSMGGLVSLYGAFYYAGSFGGAAIFSPSLQLNEQIVEEVHHAFAGSRPAQRIYFYAGRQESEEMVAKTKEMVRHLKTCTYCDVKLVISKHGEHSEENWREAFKGFYKWMNA